MKVELINAEVLRIGPDDRLLVRVADPDTPMEHVDGLVAAIAEVIAADRFLVLVGDVKVEAVVEP